MKNNLKTPRMGMVVALCVALTALWLVALYGTYEDSQREKYDVRVIPGAVTYGTHSMAIIPTVSVPMRHSSVPMISGGAVRSYAHSGHAATPSATGSGFRLHTTSSATVHTIGSGGGGGSMGTSSGSSSSSRGIQSSGVSISMPTLALATPTYVTQSETFLTSSLAAAPGRNGRVKKAAPGWDGDEGDTEEDSDESGKWWYWDPDGEEWVTDENMSGSYVGLTRNTGSGIEVWNGSSWVTMEEWQNPGVPVGATPWLLMLLFVGAYGIVKTMHKKQNTI